MTSPRAFHSAVPASALRSHWQFNPKLEFLNHGSFGATPTVVLQYQNQLRVALEFDPIEFLAPERSLEPKLDASRRAIASVVGADADDLAFVRNATEGVNAVLGSFPFEPEDEIIITNHGYNACNNAAYHVANRCGAKVIVAQVPFPISEPDQVVAAIESRVSRRTRLILVDHITSPTGLIFPVEEIAAMASQHGIRILVDGAHAPGMIPLNLASLNVDFYTANHHKWLCAPKTSGFLWVRRELQHLISPAVISHAANRARPGRTKYLAQFDWQGTFDPTPILCVPAALEFLQNVFSGGLDELMTYNRNLALQSRRLLCDQLDVQPVSPPGMIGSLVAFPLVAERFRGSAASVEQLQVRLRMLHHFELPVYTSPVSNSYLFRISLQCYNTIEQVQRLADVLKQEFSEPTT